MGTEVSRTNFREEDFRRFSGAVVEETAQVKEWVRSGAFSDEPPHVGQEIEGCILDENYQPLSINKRFIAQVNDPTLVEELAGFNFEYNSPPVELKRGCIERFSADFTRFIQNSFNVAEEMRVRLLMTGILPTITPSDLSRLMMSASNRYGALLERFNHWNQDNLNLVTIRHRDSLAFGMDSIMMEAATTSHQIHLQVREPEFASYYNAAQIIAGPLLAGSCNSPYFLGCHLWDETRVPLFEQILGPRFTAPGRTRKKRHKDFFGTAYVREGALELFESNRDSFAVMLPEHFGEGLVPHLRLHNGTIWRWNRPVIGEDAEGKPTLRIEMRFLPSGPSNLDMCGNTALLLGAVIGLVEGRLAGKDGESIQGMLPFAKAKRNFYSCARDGLAADVEWFEGERLPVKRLLEEEIIPLAKATLKKRGFSAKDMAFLGHAVSRIETGNTGARWQTAFMERYGRGSSSQHKLTASYWRRQVQGLPVFRWSL